MLIPLEEIVASVTTENPWWSSRRIAQRFEAMERRVYFGPFSELVTKWDINRAVILLGPRRVGKTVMTHHLISKLIKDGIKAKSIMYVSIDTPTYTGQSLQFFVDLHARVMKLKSTERRVVIFDEIQYLSDWERHLKTLVDKNPHIRFVASGSAAAALRLASVESGAGRFTDFMLPPLTFEEYLLFTGKTGLAGQIDDSTPGPRPFPRSHNIEKLNKEFVSYINYGGYPEAVVSEEIRLDAARYIKNDIIDKVLLRDLPQLYGITNIQELNNLFTSLAYQTGNEISLESLASNSGISKPTITRYIEYLEAAFLIFRVRRVDQSAKTFARERTFKVFLTNPSMRAALFSPLKEDSEAFGHLVETAIYSQWFHANNRHLLHYARWSRSGRAKSKLGDHGEIDLVYIGSEMKPSWLIEIKWSDTAFESNSNWSSIIEFIEAKKAVKSGVFTSKTIYSEKEVGGVKFRIVPAAMYCYTVGYNIVRHKGSLITGGNNDKVPSE